MEQLDTTNDNSFHLHDFVENYTFNQRSDESVQELLELLDRYEGYFQTLRDFQVFFDGFVEVGETLIRNGDERNVSKLVDFILTHPNDTYLSIAKTFKVELEFEKYIDNMKELNKNATGYEDEGSNVNYWTFRYYNNQNISLLWLNTKQ